MRGIELPESVTTEILSRLPVKSLTRFRCVCKPWASCFQTPYFISKHYRNSLDKNSINLLLRRSDYAANTHYSEITYFSALSSTAEDKGQDFVVVENIHLPYLFSYFEVYGPCNGLLYLSDNPSYSGKSAIWNPSTRQFRIVPQSTLRPPRPSWKEKEKLFSTRFEAIGFGFDSATDDYKVVSFVTDYFKADNGSRRWVYHVRLYSLKSDSWKEISAPNTHPMPGEIYWFNNYVNGFYYWPASVGMEKIILSFDMATEKFSTLPWPNVSAGYDWLDLFDFNGLLGAISYTYTDAGISLDLWVMNGGSWTKGFSIESVPRAVKLLGFWKNGEIFIDSLNDELVLFDPSTKEVKNLGITNGICDCMYRMKLIAYVESLVPINGRSEQEEQIIRQPAGEASNRY